ncbi:MAG: hypothetical protein ACJA1R_002176, partial [Flavobacteriales bacterium]
MKRSFASPVRADVPPRLARSCRCSAARRPFVPMFRRA